MVGTGRVLSMVEQMSEEQLKALPTRHGMGAPKDFAPAALQ